MAGKNRVNIRRIVLGLLFVVLALPAHAATVVFDQGHGERFLVGRDGPLDLSSLAAIVSQHGGRVTVVDGPLTDAALTTVDALVMSGPFASPTEEEIETLCRFLQRGGRLAVLLHIGTPAGRLLHRLGVDFSNSIVREQHDIIAGDPANFSVSRFEPHPLLAGVRQFSLHGVWALMAFADNARVIASTGPDAWVDLDGDGSLSSGDAVQSFGVAVAGTLGKGEYVVFGDDAIFQNKFLDDDNRRLATNLAVWLNGGAAREEGDANRQILLKP
ncbi:MAG TPA: DUF4350 domain-containing protein [Geobacteraceae bacterium]